MSNQLDMTFDEDFFLDRLVECLSICAFQVKSSFENEYFFHKSYEQAQGWLKRYQSLLGFDSCRVIYVQSLLDNLNASFLEHQSRSYLESEELEAVQVHNAKNQQVSKPAASAQLPVFRVLGKEPTKLRPVHLLNEEPGWESYYRRFHPYFRTTLTVTKRILSHTRPVGGLA